MTGAILGVVEVVDCVSDSASTWAQTGCWHWVLANPRVFNEPITYRGAPLLFHVPTICIPPLKNELDDRC